jgi:putative SOS response-associated peptidase YedK
MHKIFIIFSFVKFLLLFTFHDFMCGRFALFGNIGDIELAFNARAKNNISYKENFNIAPSQESLIIKESGIIESAKWGVHPSWSTHDIINIRQESLIGKNTFNKLDRCLILANGFFEWKTQCGHKIPQYISLSNRKYFAFAGLYENNRFAILTMQANDFIKPLHDRMPIIILKDSQKEYLSKNPYKSTDEKMQSWNVTQKMNDSKFNEELCITKIQKM